MALARVIALAAALCGLGGAGEADAGAAGEAASSDGGVAENGASLLQRGAHAARVEEFTAKPRGRAGKTHSAFAKFVDSESERNSRLADQKKAVAGAVPEDAPAGGAGGTSAARVLRVCTTGDYPPMTSYDPSTEEYSGLDLTVLRHFGSSRNYTVELVPTTWANLSDDLRSGTKCLLAAGGITLTEERRSQFAVSREFLASRKAPVFSRANAGRFDSFADVDKPDVTVVENAGGTNAAFVAKLVKQGLLPEAKVEIVRRNEEAYACLVGRAQAPLVMFTDSLEVEYRTSVEGSVLSPKGLDMQMPPGFDAVDYKVYMARNTTEGLLVMAEIDRFLEQALATGLFEAWRRHDFAVQYPERPADCPLVPDGP